MSNPKEKPPVTKELSGEELVPIARELIDDIFGRLRTNEAFVSALVNQALEAPWIPLSEGIKFLSNEATEVGLIIRNQMRHCLPDSLFVTDLRKRVGEYT